MANEYAVNQADLTSVADAIREKGGTAAPLAFPAGFISAIRGIKAGGGASLQVIAVSGEDALPETANENTIAVLTELEIGTVYVQNTQPETANAGDVFITTGNILHTINLAEDGALQVNLGPVYIFNGTAWEATEAYLYTGGEWVRHSNVVYLYRAGSKNEDITGGWQAGEGGGTATITDTSMQLEILNTSSQRKHVATGQAIDLAKYSALHVTFTVQNVSLALNPANAVTLRIGIGTAYNANLASLTTKKEAIQKTTGTVTLDYDLSSITASRFIIIGIGYPSATVTIDRVWLDEVV